MENLARKQVDLGTAYIFDGSPSSPRFQSSSVTATRPSWSGTQPSCRCESMLAIEVSWGKNLVSGKDLASVFYLKKCRLGDSTPDVSWILQIHCFNTRYTKYSLNLLQSNLPFGSVYRFLARAGSGKPFESLGDGPLRNWICACWACAHLGRWGSKFWYGQSPVLQNLKHNLRT